MGGRDAACLSRLSTVRSGVAFRTFMLRRGRTQTPPAFSNVGSALVVSFGLRIGGAISFFVVVLSFEDWENREKNETILFRTAEYSLHQTEEH